MPGDLPVYVTHWNAPDWVRATTDAFLASTLPVRVTVVDNGPYGSPLALDPRVHVITTGENLGYAGGGNVGIADWLAGDAELCVIACHDVRLEPDGLERLVAAAADLADFGVLGPDPAENVSSGRVLASGPGVREVVWASGACLLLRRACIERIGPFDAGFGSYGEDIDLCHRARAAGWKVGIVPGVPARGTGSVDPGFRTQMYVNQVRFQAKHGGTRGGAKMLAALPVLAAGDAARWLLRRDAMARRRASGRARAVPAGARLVWAQARARGRGRGDAAAPTG